MSDPVVRRPTFPNCLTIPGKTRLRHCTCGRRSSARFAWVCRPLVNHWWNVPLYVTSRGLTTSPMPYGSRTLEICFDFIDHKLLIETSDGEIESWR